MLRRTLFKCLGACVLGLSQGRPKKDKPNVITCIDQNGHKATVVTYNDIAWMSWEDSDSEIPLPYRVTYLYHCTFSMEDKCIGLVPIADALYWVGEKTAYQVLKNKQEGGYKLFFAPLDDDAYQELRGEIVNG